MTINHTDIIKDKLSILDVVGSYVKLEKAGKTWKGKSPFTNEKTPSFFVSPEKGFFYCFSSGKGGDIFNFIQEIERIDFREALKLLADKAGVSLNNQHISMNGVLYNLLNEASKFYEIQLRKNTKVVDYLLDRALTKETIVSFRLGFAPESWTDIYVHLKKKGYKDEDIVQAGLIVKRDKGGGFYNRFRSRIMFPLMDSQGRIIGFSGRIFSDEPHPKEAKYVNSPEGPLFDKSKLLYGYHTAKHEISKQDSCILVEGQFDVLMAQQSGSVNTVAVSGTGLTDDHLTMIKRFSRTLLLSFDSDKAGIKATKRSVLKAYEHGMKVKVIVLPLGKDPADVLKEGSSAWQVYVADAKDYIDYRLELFEKQHETLSFEDKHKLVEQELFDFIYLIHSSVAQDRTLQKIALFLGVAVDSVRKDFDKYEPQKDISSINKNTYPVEESDYLTTKEPQNEPKLSESHDYVLALSLYFKYRFTQLWKEKSKELKKLFQEAYEQDLDDCLNRIDDTHREMLLFKQDVQLKETDGEKLFNTLRINLYHELARTLKRLSDDILTQIRQSELRGEQEKLMELQQKNQSIRKRIDKLPAS